MYIDRTIRLQAMGKYASFESMRLVLLLTMLGSVLNLSAQQKPFDNSGFADLYDIKIHYRVWQGLTPMAEPLRGHILLVHGFSGSTFSWEGLAPKLADAGYEVVALDLPPFGYSDKRSMINHDETAQALLAWALADQLYPEAKWVLGGHSMGAGIAGVMAAHRPDDVSKIIYVDGAFMPSGSDTRSSIRFLMGSRLVGNLAELVGQVYFFNTNRIGKLVESAYATRPTDAQVAGYLGGLDHRGTARGIIEMATKSERVFDYNPESVKAPGLVIWGSQDSWIPKKVGEQFVESLGDARWVLVEGAGHCPMETHVGETLRAILDFLGED